MSVSNQSHLESDETNELTNRLAHAAQIAHDLSRTLRSQREMLQQRNVTLPLIPIEELSDVYAATTGIINRLGAAHTIRRELNNLRELARNTELITSTLDLDLILSDVVDTVVELTGAERGYVILYDAHTRVLEFKVARDAEQRDLNAGEVTVSQAVIDRAIEERQVIVTSDATGDERFDASQSIARMRLISILCVPLIRKGRVTGVIYADSRMRAGLFNREEQALVQAFANQAALAIENARMYENVRTSLMEITAMRDLMSNVFESIASGVITLDSADQITTLNTAAAKILNVSLIDCYGQPVHSILPLSIDRLQRILQQVRQRKTVQFEVDLTVAGRGIVNLNLNFSPLRSGGVLDSPIQQETPLPTSGGIVVVLSDETEEKKHRAQMNVLNRYLPPALIDNINIYDRSELGGVEREISVLSCDIRGFTRFSENLDPQDLMQIINIYLGIGSDAIHAEGGVIDKYIGDAITALFNTQINVQPDHALRAVRSALRLTRAVQIRHAVLPPEQRLFFGVGVHTGSAVLGNVGSENRKEFTAIGDTVQIAKLLQENALQGEVLISPELYSHVAPYFECESLSTRKQKHTIKLPSLFRVISEREQG